MPDADDEARRFQEIVAQFRVHRRGRTMLLLGISLCLIAVALITFGGVKGAVIAVIPWILGLILVVRSRARH